MITVNGIPLVYWERSQGYSAVRALHAEKPRIWLRRLMQPGATYTFDELRTLVAAQAITAGYELTDRRLERTVRRMIARGEVESVTPPPDGPRRRGARYARYRKVTP